MDEDEIADVRPLAPYVLRISLADGSLALVGVEKELYGPAFEPPREPSVFAKREFDLEAGMIVWPDGADFSPEFLLESARATIR